MDVVIVMSVVAIVATIVGLLALAWGLGRDNGEDDDRDERDDFRGL